MSEPFPQADVFPRREPTRENLGPVIAVIAVGGALGAAARYLAGEQWPTAPGTFPLTTALINVLGSAAIGVLLVVVGGRWAHRPLLRPFLGTGFLGGFTTFSAYAVDVHHLATGGRPVLAALYLVATPVLALLAAAVGSGLARTLFTRRSR